MEERTEIIGRIGCLLEFSLLQDFESDKLDEPEHVFEAARKDRKRGSHEHESRGTFRTMPGLR